MGKIKKYPTLILVTLIIMLFGSVTVNAEEEVNSRQRNGSIEIELTDGGLGTSKEGVVFTYEKVADLLDGEYVLLDEYQKSGIDFNKIEHAKDMEAAAKLLLPYTNADLTVTTDKTGKAEITDLPIGVYLIHVIDKAEYDEITPLLIAIPTFNEISKDMEYDLTVMPKHTPNPPGTIVTETPKTEIVETGDHAKSAQWIVLMCGCAAIILILGIRKGRKEE